MSSTRIRWNESEYELIALACSESFKGLVRATDLFNVVMKAQADLLDAGRQRVFDKSLFTEGGMMELHLNRVGIQIARRGQRVLAREPEVRVEVAKPEIKVTPAVPAPALVESISVDKLSTAELLSVLLRKMVAEEVELRLRGLAMQGLGLTAPAAPAAPVSAPVQEKTTAPVAPTQVVVPEPEFNAKLTKPEGTSVLVMASENERQNKDVGRYIKDLGLIPQFWYKAEGHLRLRRLLGAGPGAFFVHGSMDKACQEELRKSGVRKILVGSGSSSIFREVANYATEPKGKVKA